MNRSSTLHRTRDYTLHRGLSSNTAILKHSYPRAQLSSSTAVLERSCLRVQLSSSAAVLEHGTPFCQVSVEIFTRIQITSSGPTRRQFHRKLRLQPCLPLSSSRPRKYLQFPCTSELNIRSVCSIYARICQSCHWPGIYRLGRMPHCTLVPCA